VLDIKELLTRATTTKHLLLAEGAFARTGEIVPADSIVAPVTDAVAWQVAGDTVVTALRRDGVVLADPLILDGSPLVTPTLEAVATVRDHLAALGSGIFPLAIGSGTINDLVKRAAFEVGAPYGVVATAASMDGYTASGAALIADGVKQTFPCDAPVAVVADPAVLAAAPASMTASGYGDLLGKVSAGADWLIADALGIEPIDAEVWASVQDPLPGLLADPRRYQRGDESAVAGLFLALANTGLAIQATGSSRPASGSEHQFSHYWEMRGLEIGGIPVSHGFKVGIGSLIVAALYERLLQRDLAAIDVAATIAARPTWDEIETRMSAMHAIPAIRDKALAEMAAKRTSDDVLAHRLATLREVWPTLRERLAAQVMSPAAVADLLHLAGCPATPMAIGLSRDEARESIVAAMQIRQRYTIYDLLFDLDMLDDIVAEAFGPEGVFAPVTG
jgi:glycerol-1-phosphate dehydrogenase [NAD(P)+]